MSKSKFNRIIVLILVSLFLSSCGYVSNVLSVGSFLKDIWINIGKEDTIVTESIVVQNAVNLNNDYPLAFDIAFVFDSELTKSMAGVPARDWFRARKNQFKRDYPLSLTIREYEFAPGPEKRQIEITDKEKQAQSSFVFANYRKPGIHRARLGKIENPIIRLRSNSFSIFRKP